jgi:hypothetical protein
MVRDQRQRLGAVIRLKQGRIGFHLLEKGYQALSVDWVIINDQNFHGFLLSARLLVLRKWVANGQHDPRSVLGPTSHLLESAECAFSE